MTADTFDPYLILGVPREANADSIRAAYRRGAAAAHPDRDGGSHARMADVNKAYGILSEPTLRANFDAGNGTALPPSVQMQAQQLLLGMVAGVLRAAMASPDADIIDLLRKAVNAQLAGLLSERAQVERQVATLRGRLTRLKGPPQNFIAGVIEGEIGARTVALKQTVEDQRVFEECLEILRAYSYEQTQTLYTSSLLFSAYPGGLTFFKDGIR